MGSYQSKGHINKGRTSQRVMAHATALTLACLLTCAATALGQRKGDGVRSGKTYTNPVFEPILADPTVIRDSKTDYFYAYGTEDNWADGKGNRLMPIIRSVNLIDWEYVGEVFKQKPAWKAAGGLWAPDINKVKGQYILYYSFSAWADPNPGIGVATATSPAGPFYDRGKLFSTEDIDVPNSIDPSVYSERGNNYLIWGSFGDGPTQGIHLIALSKDATQLAAHTQKVKLAAGDWEAAMLHQRGGYYYFFGSKGSCCEGADSQYRVYVARSKNISGPYEDRTGNAITERGAGTLVLQGSADIAGPGHHAKILTDDRGNDWLLYHAIWKEQPWVGTRTSRRTLMLDHLQWKDGWPLIEGNSPSTTAQPAPYFK